MSIGFQKNRMNRNLPNYLSIFLVMTGYGCNEPQSLNPLTARGASGQQSCPVKFQTKRQNHFSHIPPQISQFSDQGTLPVQQDLTLTIALKMNDEEDLDQRLTEIYTPGGLHFHQFLTSDEFHSRYSPTEKQIEQVTSYLQSHGIQTASRWVENRHSHSLLKARGSVGALNSAFHTEIHKYRNSSGQIYFAPAIEVEIPADLPIQAISGLQNVVHFRNYAKSHAIKASASHNGNGPNGGFTPSEIQKAYQLPRSLEGTGETLALFELDGYSDSDIKVYENQFGLPNVPLKNILIDGATGSPSGNGGENEVTLDIELMIAMAPGAKQILIYEGPNTEQGMLDTYGKIADDNLAREVSTSWGLSEEHATTSMLEAENHIFKQMAAQGQSIFGAAGDDGAYDNGSSLSVDDPGSQPYMVAVGGTKLTLNLDGSYANETTWGDSMTAAGGGGISSIWTQPRWQNGLANSQNLGSTEMRTVPDVSLNSDPNTGYAIYSSGNWTVYGGTSCAAPLWAAYTALVNQHRITNGLSAVGFLNPALYQLGRSARYQSDFYDIKDGSTNLYYPATAGYDLATGWGSFIGLGLFQDLIQNLQPPLASQNSWPSNCTQF